MIFSRKYPKMVKFRQRFQVQQGFNWGTKGVQACFHAVLAIFVIFFKTTLYDDLLDKFEEYLMMRRIDHTEIITDIIHFLHLAIEGDYPDQRIGQWLLKILKQDKCLLYTVLSQINTESQLPGLTKASIQILIAFIENAMKRPDIYTINDIASININVVLKLDDRLKRQNEINQDQISIKTLVNI